MVDGWSIELRYVFNVTFPAPLIGHQHLVLANYDDHSSYCHQEWLALVKIKFLEGDKIFFGISKAFRVPLGYVE